MKNAIISSIVNLSKITGLKNLEKILNSRGGLFVFSLHSTNKRDASQYIELLSTIDSISPFIDTNNVDLLQLDPHKRHSLLTLDDGFVDNFSFSHAVLEPLNIKALFFILPYFLTHSYEPDLFLKALFPLTSNDTSYDVEDFIHLTRKHVNQMLDNGHNIGIHGYKHELITSLSLDQLDYIIAKGNTLLNELNVSTKHFCYPFGHKASFSHETNKLLLEHFDFLHLGLRGTNHTYNLQNRIIYRHPISYHGKDRCYKPFSSKVATGFAFDPIIRCLNRLRRQSHFPL